MIIITTDGLGEKVKTQFPDVEAVYEIKPGVPLMTQLAPFAKATDLTNVRVASADNWLDADREMFAQRVNECLVNIALSRNTINAYKDHWQENCWWNHDACMEAEPIDQIPLFYNEAVIVGAGPSAAGFKPKPDQQTYVAWSALNRIDCNPDIIGHCDHRAQDVNLRVPNIGIAFTPYCAREFVKTYSSSFKYLYLDLGNPTAWKVAEKRKLPEHSPIIGHVVDMLTQTALYVGHKKISFIGLDLCFRSREDLIAYELKNTGSEPQEDEMYQVSNYRGEVVWSSASFRVFREGLEELIKRHPDVTFTTSSDTGMVIEGVVYEPR